MGRRSNGCVTCKSRRVRCDEAEPKCKRCKTAERDCEYGPKTWFIDEGVRIKRSLQVASAQQEEWVGRMDSSQPIYHSAPSVPPRMATLMPLTAFANDMSLAFLFNNIFAWRGDYETDPMAIHQIRSGWWFEVATKQSPKPLQALALIFFARANASPELNKKAIKLYGESISSLRCDLNRQKSHKSFHVLTATTALCMYEVISQRTGSGWKLHVDGLSRLIQMRGPKAYKSYPQRSMLLEHRAILVSKAIICRERIFFAQPEWKTVPWEDAPESKAPPDYLMDMLCDVADILADMQILKSTKFSTTFNICNRTRILLERLNDWWRAWTPARLTTAVISNPATTIIKDSEGVIFPTVLQYDSILTLHAICLYNLTRLFLLAIWNKLSHCSHVSEDIILDEPNDSPLLGITSDIKGLAHEIIRSFGYCFDRPRRFIGTFSVVFPHDVAYACLPPDSREAKFIASHCDGIYRGVLSELFGEMRPGQDAEPFTIKETLDGAGLLPAYYR